MAKKISTDDFAKEVVNTMKQYTKDVVEGINKKVKELGDKGASELQKVVLPNASEIGTANPSERRQWKNYSKSWENNYTEGTNYAQSTIRNRKYYPLTHLLEYGHSTIDGKRTRAFKHLEPVETELDNQLLKDAEDIIKKGGK